MKGSLSPVASNVAQVSEPGGTSASDNSRTDSSDNSQQSSLPRRKQLTKKDPHPPGFRTLIQRVDRFRGCQGDDNFEIWLMDFEEATEHCGWQDKQRAKQFSWFLSGPAKATYQHTLRDANKATQQNIVVNMVNTWTLEQHTRNAKNYSITSLDLLRDFQML